MKPVLIIALIMPGSCNIFGQDNPYLQIDRIVLLDSNINFRSIYKDKDKTYHLFEEVYNVEHWEISKRVSTDGLKMSERSQPLFQPGEKERYDSRGQADPTVLKEKREWKMWFDALNNTGIWDSIGYATSREGENWIKHEPVLGRGSPGSWDDKSVHHPCCIKYKGIYYLYYSGASQQDKNIVKHIGLATSDDGINFTKYGNMPLLKTSAAGEWDCEYVRPSRPFIIEDKWYMLYWGYDGSYRCIGLAISDDGLNWSKAGKLLGNDSGEKNKTNLTACDVILEYDKNTEDVIIQVWYSTYNPKEKGVYLCFTEIKRNKLK